jgi:hypothetical protein
VLRRVSVLLLAPVLVLLALAAWAVSSPVGSGPDDDFHLVSIWCASPSSAEYCRPTGAEGERRVAEALAHPACFAFDAEKSAGCQRDLDFSAEPETTTTRGNFAGGYPPVYYATMGLLAGGDVAVSVILMRLLNALLFVGLGTAIYLLLPVARRPALVWSWAITTVPLGLFILTSTNPSSWAIMGVGYGWVALLGFFETAGWRRIPLGGLFVLSAVMAAGARSDAALFTVLGVVAVGILTFARTRIWLLSAILPALVAIGCILTYRFSRPVSSLTSGIAGPGTGGPAQPQDPLSLLAYNFLEGPSLWTGVFGDEWGLGWLDTSMPAFVWFGALASFLGVGFAALRSPGWRKVVVLAGGVVVLWMLPTLVLVAAGDEVGENMQPRYLLPLIVLFAGVLLLGTRLRPVPLARTQVWLVVAALAAAHSVALFLDTQRYVSGFDDLGPDLNSGIEWWWDWSVSPMAVWVVGSLAFAAALVVLLPRHAGVMGRVEIEREGVRSPAM